MRESEQIREDLAEGYVTPAGARRDYGVEAPDALLASGPSLGTGRGTGAS